MNDETYDVEQNEAGERAPSKMKPADAHDLEFILDIPLELSVELGRCKMLVNDLLQLGQ